MILSVNPVLILKKIVKNAHLILEILIITVYVNQDTIIKVKI